MPHRHSRFIHCIESANPSMDFGFESGREIVCHDDRITQRAGFAEMVVGAFDRDAACLAGTSEITGNHRDHHLWQAGRELIGLDYENRTSPSSAQIRIWEKHPNDVAPPKGHRKRPRRNPQSAISSPQADH